MRRYAGDPGGRRRGDGPASRRRVSTRRVSRAVSLECVIGVSGQRLRQAPAEVAFSRDFWRGIVDADGCLAIVQKKYPMLSLCGHCRLLEQFLTFANGVCGTKATVRPHKSIYSVQIGGLTGRKVIDCLYSEACVVLDRKAKKASDLLHL